MTEKEPEINSQNVLILLTISLITRLPLQRAL